MPKIGPALDLDKLEKCACCAREGDGIDPGLPGVMTDAWDVDPDAYEINGRMAELIKALVHELKPNDRGVPRFVLAWRMYPNAKSNYWKGDKLLHSCGCACGCSTHKKKRKKRKNNNT